MYRIRESVNDFRTGKKVRPLAVECSQGLHPAPKDFYRQDEAVQVLQKPPGSSRNFDPFSCGRASLRLVEDGEYERWQVLPVEVLSRRRRLGLCLSFKVGLFAEEVGAGGKRRHLLGPPSNPASCCLARLPPGSKSTPLPALCTRTLRPGIPKIRIPPRKTISTRWTRQFGQQATSKKQVVRIPTQVILQDQPCWLYFDLEFSRLTNPELQPNLAMTAFDETLSAFCQDVLGLALDANSVIVLESSTPEKFSKHVVVHRLLDKEKDTTVPLAFANNAQAGLFVNELVNYARANRECSSARHLFVQAPKLSDDGRETTLIDESVYSRNRSFRLLFQSKFAKKRRLELDEASGKRFFDYWRPHPSRALLETMVTFVPPKTELFRHTLIPEGFGHMDAKSLRVRRAGPAVVRDSEGKVQVIQQDPLLNFLVRTWDGVRAEEEHGPFPPTLVQSCVEMDRRFLTVTLSNNRFCRCKGSSHVSNHVYMVVDMERRSFYQHLN